MEQWAKLLFIYGPFGLLILFVFVIEGRARKARQEGRPPRWVTDGIYGLTWVAIFAIAGFASYIWVVLNIHQELTIRGTLEGLQESETITSRSANFYSRRIYGLNNHFDCDWRIITDHRLTDGEKVSFYFDRGIKDGPSATLHNLIVHPGFYDTPVKIVYHRNTDKLYLVLGDRKEELPSVDDVAASTPAPPRWPSWEVHAESYPSWDSLAKQLESVDPIIRRDARTQLAQQGRGALPFIDKILQDRTSSYRLRLGALVALNEMPNLGPAPALSRSAYDTIAMLATNRDTTIRVAAARALKRYPVPPAIR